VKQKRCLNHTDSVKVLESEVSKEGMPLTGLKIDEVPACAEHVVKPTATSDVSFVCCIFIRRAKQYV